jgi:GNAT superfamily N-acetyltransferase
MHIRPYTTEDWDRVCQIHDAARRDELAAAGLAAAFLTLEETAGNEGFHEYTVRVAEVEGRLVGFAAYTADELAWLYVEPSSYRKGVGTALIKHAPQRFGELERSAAQGHAVTLQSARELRATGKHEHAHAVNVARRAPPSGVSARPATTGLEGERA